MENIDYWFLDLENFTKTWNFDYSIWKAIKILEEEKLFILSWLKNNSRTDFIKELIITWDFKNNYFYFNKLDDINNFIDDNKALEKLFETHQEKNNKSKIVILEKITKLKWIKKFIADLYNNWYKTILVWNDIKIWWIKEIEVLNNKKIDKQNYKELLNYWQIQSIIELDSNKQKQEFLKLIISDIFLYDIFKNFWVKSIDQYIQVITFLAKNNNFLSLRELQRELELLQNISLKTVIDYIDFSLKSKIIKKVVKYDFKKQKEINSKVKYYFSDNWIRNSLSDFKLEKNILIENLIFNKLEFNNYEVFSWTNWKFEFSFYAKQNTKKQETIFIHISNQETKEELKKEVNKLLKLWQDWKKYLIIESIEKLGIKKLKYEDLEIIEVLDFLERFD